MQSSADGPELTTVWAVVMCARCDSVHLLVRILADSAQQRSCSNAQTALTNRIGMQGEQKLDRLRESELVHGRWAMLGVVGCLLPEIMGLGNWFEAPLWAVNGGQPTYVGVPVPFDIKTIILVEIVAMAGVELLRSQENEPLKRAYPGGAFDPMGMAVCRQQCCDDS